MYCPFCNETSSKVVESRDSQDGIRRRRECLRCGLRYTTYERVQTKALMVIKQDGRREVFNKDKLWTSLTKACAKRPLPIGSIDKVADEIEAQLSGLGRAEIPSNIIGELVMDRLRGLDRVAYIRFASVDRDFRDIESFREEVDALLEPRETSSTPTNQLSFLEDMDGFALKPKGRRRGRPKKVPTETA